MATPYSMRKGGLLLLLLAGFLLAGLTRNGRRATAGPATAEAATEAPYDLAALRVLSRAILLIKDNYVQPDRIQPKAMVFGALEEVEKRVPEVMVDGSEKTGKATVTVGDASRTFDLSDVDSIWKVPHRLGEVFRFIQEHLVTTEDIPSIEYAAVNGLLGTLDPHSVLLDPESYGEMRLHTRGEFGGLGFVISMRRSKLTVMRVIRGTPASKAGVVKRDHIVKIGEESTVNMELDAAVEKLRGKPGSDIAITVLRKGWKEPRKFVLKRAQIQIESIVSRLLDHKVGYVRILNFQGNTTRDLKRVVEEMSREAGGQLSGLVVDLRNNPGGLLDQAISVSDYFLKSGTIVTTVDMSDKVKEQKRARAEDDDLQVPVAVLVNTSSASASEIVSGALQQLDRSVILGRPTFGKGSVQVLYDFPDGSALKLTVAQYLTSGDRSIQEVGIVPDIELLPARVDKEKVDFFAPEPKYGEAHLDHHFEGSEARRKSDGAIERPPSPHSITYLRDPDELRDEAEFDRADEGEEDPEDDPAYRDPEDFKVDPPIRIARDLVRKAEAPTRSAMLRSAQPFIAETQGAETARIHQQIESLGVQWNAKGAQGVVPQIAGALKVEGTARAGDTFQLALTAQNTGAAAAQRLRAWTESDHPSLDRREFLFGRLEPGQSRTWKVSVKLPKAMPTRTDAVKIHFEDESGAAEPPTVAEVATEGLPRPRFAFAAQAIDEAGNGDGLVQAGEPLKLRVDVKNHGPGPALKAIATVRNLGDEKIFIQQGRHVFGALASGAGASATFTLELRAGFEGKEVPLRISVIDEELGEVIAEEIKLPVRPALDVKSERGRVQVSSAESASIRAAPYAEAPVIGRAPRGAVLRGEARVGPFVRVRFADERLGYVASTDVGPARPSAKGAEIALVYPTEAPRIDLEGSPPRILDDEAITLRGTAEDPSGLKNLYVLVNDQKVLFRAGQGAGAQRVPFEAKVPLKHGSNSVLIIARENEDVSSRRLLFIHRRGDAKPANAAARGGAAARDVDADMHGGAVLGR